MKPAFRRVKNQLKRGLVAATAMAVLASLTSLAGTDDSSTPEEALLITELGNTLQLPTAIKLAARRNPELKAARLSWGAAVERIPQSRALPDPMIGYQYGSHEERWELSQNLPFPGTLRAAGKVTLEQARIAQIRHEMVLRNLIVNVKTSFYEVAYLERAIVMTEQNRDLMRHAVKVTNNLYSRDEASLYDLMKAETQLAQLDYDLVLLQELLLVERAQLASYFNLPAEFKFGKTLTGKTRMLAMSLSELEARAMEQRQELRIAAGQVELAEQQLRHTRFRTLPNFRLSYMRTEPGGETGTAMNDKDQEMFGIGMTIPLNFRRNRAAIKEAELTRDAAVHSRQSVASDTSAMLRKLYFRLENSRRLMRLYEDSLIPQAKRAMAIAETWNVGGQKNLSGFLETQSVWLNFNLARLRAATDYQQDLAAIERLVGTLLDLDDPGHSEEER